MCLARYDGADQNLMGAINYFRDMYGLLTGGRVRDQIKIQMLDTIEAAFLQGVLIPLLGQGEYERAYVCANRLEMSRILINLDFIRRSLHAPIRHEGIRQEFQELRRMFASQEELFGNEEGVRQIYEAAKRLYARISYLTAASVTLGVAGACAAATVGSGPAAPVVGGIGAIITGTTAVVSFSLAAIYTKVKSDQSRQNAMNDVENAIRARFVF